MNNTENVGWISFAGSGSRTEDTLLRHSVILAFMDCRKGANRDGDPQFFLSIRNGDLIKTVQVTKAMDWIFHDIARLAVEVPFADKKWLQSEVYHNWQSAIAMHEAALRGLVDAKRYADSHAVMTSPKVAVPSLDEYVPGSWMHHFMLQNSFESYHPNDNRVQQTLEWARSSSCYGAIRLMCEWTKFQDLEKPDEYQELKLWDLNGSDTIHPNWPHKQRLEHTHKRLEGLYKTFRISCACMIIGSRLSNLFPDPYGAILRQKCLIESERCSAWVRERWRNESQGLPLPEMPPVFTEAVKGYYPEVASAAP